MARTEKTRSSTSGRVRFTGFTRFLLFLFIVGPLAYFGAAYYTGEDGIQNIKNLLDFDKNKTTAEQPAPQTEAVPTVPAPVDRPADEIITNSTIARLQDDLSEREARIEKLYQENETLKQSLEAKDKELVEVKAQLEAIKQAIK
jgi:hypothetical protein